MAESIRSILEEWGEKLVDDMKASIDQAVTHGGGQTSKLSGSVNYKVLRNQSGYSFKLSMADYWKYVEAGRRKGVKGVPLDKLGKKWQNLKGINPAKIIYEIQVDYNKRKGLKRKVKKLPFEKAAKSLSFLIQRSIKKKGIEPNPFFDRVFNQSRLNDLVEKLKPVIKHDIVLDIKNILGQT